VARRIAFVAAAAAFLAALVFATAREAAVECEVCVEFGGATTCRTGRAGDRETALRGAVSTACAVLSSGVTSGMACDRTPPRSVRCTE
jgi:hypothetical protein